MKRFIAAVALMIAFQRLSPAQITSPSGTNSGGILSTSVTPSLLAVQAALGLASAQVGALQRLQDTQRQAVEAIYAQISTKQIVLDQLLNQGAPDAVVGRMMKDIRALEQQVEAAGRPFRVEALGVLTADQKVKLKVLEDAAKLQDAVWQAAELNLLDPPVVALGGVGMGSTNALSTLPAAFRH